MFSRMRMSGIRKIVDRGAIFSLQIRGRFSFLRGGQRRFRSLVRRAEYLNPRNVSRAQHVDETFQAFILDSRFK